MQELYHQSYARKLRREPSAGPVGCPLPDPASPQGDPAQRRISCTAFCLRVVGIHLAYGIHNDGTWMLEAQGTEIEEARNEQRGLASHGQAYEEKDSTLRIWN